MDSVLSWFCIMILFWNFLIKFIIKAIDEHENRNK